MEQFEESDNESSDDTNHDDVVCERLPVLKAPYDYDEQTSMFEYYKDHINVKSNSYNKVVLENIYSNALKTKRLLKSNNQTELICEKMTNLNARGGSEIHKPPAINKEKELSRAGTPLDETSQQNAKTDSIILDMPLLDFF